MSDIKNDKTNVHKGHRAKVRERYYVSGFEGMAPHNVLEMLLFFGIPYKDTNPIAHDLIDRFGSLSAVFEAKHADLMQIKGMTENAACLITMFLPLYKKYHQDLIKRFQRFSDVKETVEFLRNLFIDNCNVEQIYVLCFDAKKHLLTYRKISEGDISSSSLDFRKLASLVLETNSASVILAHNHPHGIAVPSYMDVQATKTVIRFLASLSVKVDDHIVITDDDFFSMVNSVKYVNIFYDIYNKED